MKNQLTQNPTLSKSVVNGIDKYRIWKNGQVIAEFLYPHHARSFYNHINQKAEQKMYTVQKTYRFYAAHRNELLTDKCFNLHGHQYEMTITLLFVELQENGITMLFNEIDEKMEPLVKNFDHKWIVNSSDPLYLDIAKKLEEHGIKVVEIPMPTSVENLCKYFYEIVHSGLKLPISKIGIKETNSSYVEYQPN